MKKKKTISNYSTQLYSDTDIFNGVIHIIMVEPKVYRLYSDTLKSLGTFKSLRSAVYAAKRIRKYRQMIIAVHDFDGNVVKIIRPNITGIDTSERTGIKNKARPSKSSALTIQ